MAKAKVYNSNEDQLFDELRSEFKHIPAEAIDAALAFSRVAAHRNLMLEECCAKFGLTPGRFSLLLLLRRESTRSLSPSELAKRSRVSRATMTQFVDALQKDKLVERKADPVDRRGLLIKMTAKGESILKKALPAHFEKLAHLTKVLNRSERKQLLTLLDKLAEGREKAET